MHPMMNVAIKAARSAGNIMNRASLNLERLQVARKQQNDFVTEVDRAAEAAVLEVLQESYPTHHFLAEESGYMLPGGQSLGLLAWDEVVARQKADEEEHFLWVIDPIDGTTNFIHGFPQFAVSIALLVNGVVQQGVIYDPTRDELFTATKGGGAYVNSRRIRVATQLRMADCLIGTGFPFRDDQDLETYLDLFRKMTRSCAGLRRPGAASLDLAYVAAGRLDGFFEADLKPWDMAAGVLLVQEAGGLVGQYNGEEGYFSSGQIMAANPKIFAQMATLLSKP
jgi:myo-inositol-1(or 4)-monophosphatase